MKPTILIKRAYADASNADGYRILVDRVWPRGITKERLHIKEWAKAIAPTTELRKWYGHLPERWPMFQEKYWAELAANPAIPEFIALHKNISVMTLVYAAKDEDRTHAIILQKYLKQQFDGQ